MNNGPIIWSTHKVIRQNRDVVTIEFVIGEPAFNYEPGQFINVSLMVNQEKITRSYSLSSSPDLDHYPAITVKRKEGGLMSRFIADHAENINHWEIDGPHGNFVANTDIYESGHIFLLAGGSGITPLWSLAKSIVARSQSARITLIYAARDSASLIFAEPLKMLAGQQQHRMHVFYALSGPGHQGISDQQLIQGRLSKLVVKKLIKHQAAAFGDAHFFICGPPGLTQLYEQALEGLQVPSGQIHSERFTLSDQTGPISLRSQIEREVVFLVNQQPFKVKVMPGQSLLTAAISNGLPVRYSCKAAACGSCVSNLKTGQVEMDKNYALTEDQLRQGQILLCQSYPLSDDITIVAA